jgi:hypothetical protein
MGDFKYKEFKYDDWKYDDYVESEQVNKYKYNLDNHNSSKPGEYQSKYQAVADEVLNNYMNRDKFSYDINGDALYQQYKDKFMTQGKLASQDVMAQAAAMTGGYGNSYAATVGNQAYQASLQNLNDVVPELYQMAYNQYQQEGQDMLNKYSIYADRENTEYGRYRDSVADWQSEREYLTNLYNTERSWDYSKYSDNRNFDYGVYSDDRNLAYTQYDSDRNLAYTDYRNDIADQQWQATFDEGVRQYNQNYEYQVGRDKVADQQWQDTFNQALAEFGYQKERDTIADQQWQDSYDLQAEQIRNNEKAAAYDAIVKSEENVKNAKSKILSIHDFLNNATKNVITRGNRGNTGNGGTTYTYNKKTYNTYTDYVFDVLDGLNLTDDEMATVLKDLGLA